MNYIGIDIGGTNLKAGLVNDEGSILAMEKRKIAEVSDQKALVEALVALTQSLTERGGLTPEQIRSVGVGVPGAVEIHSGAVLYTCNLPLRNVPLRKRFHRYLPYPLYVENDANCAALAEYYAGAVPFWYSGISAPAVTPSRWTHWRRSCPPQAWHCCKVVYPIPCAGRTGTICRSRTFQRKTSFCRLSRLW